MSQSDVPRVARRVLVRGKVQGVFFRAWTQRQARAVGLRGWVRNLSDGETVEALLIGPADAVAAVEAMLAKGPPQARVREVEGMDATDDGSVEFEQVPTV
ncbi:MAG: acylphosphatase [Alphaproteobacteria bacterium]|nr:acylphosphatase [Alphaproteobacteria bacterium]